MVGVHGDFTCKLPLQNLREQKLYIHPFDETVSYTELQRPARLLQNQNKQKPMALWFGGGSTRSHTLFDQSDFIFYLLHTDAH